jgi:hypothetical protein
VDYTFTLTAHAKARGRDAALGAGVVGVAAERMTRRSRHAAERATDREVGVVAAVLTTGSEKAAAHRLDLSHSTVRHHLGERAVEGGAGDDSAAGVDPWSAASWALRGLYALTGRRPVNTSIRRAIAHQPRLSATSVK